MKKLFLLALTFAASFGYSQTLNIEFGSAIGPTPDFDGLFFTDPQGVRFPVDGSSQASLSVGYFAEAPTTGQSLSNYISDFQLVGVSQSFTGGTSPGFFPASEAVTGTEATTAGGNQAYVFVLGGVDSFSSAAEASSYGLFSNSSGWDITSLSGSSSAATDTFRTLQPDTIIAGNLTSVSDGFEFQAIPEPSAYATILGLLGLGYAVFCRRRRSSSTD